MTSDPSNASVLDAVAAELSRFSRDVVTEVHRLRDELLVVQRRVTALEEEVAALRRTGTAPVSLGVLARPVAANVDPVSAPSHEPEVAAQAMVEFAPLTLESEGNSVPASTGLSNLARVLAELSEPIAVAWPTDS